MAKVTIKLNKSAFSGFLNSADISSGCENIAKNLVHGDNGYTVTTQKGQSRAQIRIEATSAAAIADNLANNTLVKAVSK